MRGRGRGWTAIIRAALEATFLLLLLAACGVQASSWNYDDLDASAGSDGLTPDAGPSPDAAPSDRGSTPDTRTGTDATTSWDSALGHDTAPAYDAARPDTTATPDRAGPDLAGPDTWAPDTWAPDTWAPDTATTVGLGDHCETTQCQAPLICVGDASLAICRRPCTPGGLDCNLTTELCIGIRGESGQVEKYACVPALGADAVCGAEVPCAEVFICAALNGGEHTCRYLCDPESADPGCPAGQSCLAFSGEAGGACFPQ